MEQEQQHLSDWETLTTLIQHTLVRMLELDLDSQAFAQLEDYFRELEAMPPIQAWQHESCLELCSQSDSEWTAERVFEALNRQYGEKAPPVRLELLNVSVPLHVPPLPVPFVPIARHPLSGAMTVATWIPGLSSVLESAPADILREFWCTDFIQCVWSSPASIRAFLGASHERLSLERVPPHHDFRALDARAPDYPWLDAADILIRTKDLKELGLSCNLMRAISAAPLYRGENIVTVLSSRRLSAQVIGRLQQTLRTTATIFQVRGEQPAIEQLISRTEADNIDPSRIFRTAPVHRHPSKTHQPPTLRADLETEAVRVVNTCLLKAVKLRASDVIFAETPDALRVRYKVDGQWMDEPGGLPLAVAKEVINHIKMRSQLDISITRLAQDGHLVKDLEGRRYTFRVNTSMDISGQKAVLRIQPGFDTIRSLEDYGMPHSYINSIDQTLAGSSGLIVLCGPTGCGKSTTIYSILARIPSTYNVLTAEDPPEIPIPLPHIFQARINVPGGETFASWTRGLVRQAPCIAMVGEMRDPQTVEAVMHVSSSGHRIISTLHTTSAWGIPSRLEDLKAERFYVSQALSVGISQRLVRMLCPNCQIQVPVPSSDKLLRMGLDPERFQGISHLAKGRGCPYCHGRGTYGRRAIFEALLVDDEVREAIEQRATALELREISRRRGEQTIFEKALAEACDGRISLQEACATRCA
jgi:type II secretory ATPase GspE/PulE/Tfp pilus assembly ATPase PilB-like protein